MIKAYLFDLDGTLADLTHRLHHITPVFDAQGMLPPKNWDAFFAACGDDKPIEHIGEVAFALSHSAKIIIVSGRSDQVRDVTIAWLDDHLIPYDAIYMRAAGDHRPDHIVKGELLDRVIADGYAPIMAFEDRDQVVKMWRERGIPCAQVAEGNF